MDEHDPGDLSTELHDDWERFLPTREALLADTVPLSELAPISGVTMEELLERADRLRARIRKSVSPAKR